jgi:hypothetical protein
MDLKAMWSTLPRAARIYLTAVGGVSVAAVATVVTMVATDTPLLAATPSPSPSARASGGTNFCSDFTGHLANNLGKSQSQTQKAINDAIGQTIDDAVKAGNLTQAQANAIKARLSGNNAQACVGGLGGVAGIGRPGRPGFGPRLGAVTQDEIAAALGVSTAELQQDLRNGQTVKDIAAAKGIDEAAFRTKLGAAVKADLDQQVAAGKITQQQENAALQRIQNGPLPLWNAPVRRPGAGPRQPKAAPGASPSPSPSATP